MGKTESSEKQAKDNTAPEKRAPADASPPTDGTDELSAAKKEAAAAQDRFLRAAADLENFRRRTLREKEELRLFGAARTLEDLLPVLDNLNLGLSAARQPNADLKVLVGGMELVQQQLKTVLASHGLVEIAPVGQPFDPHSQEAISHQTSADVPAEHVLTVVRAGFSLNGRLVRPAAVIVSSGPAKKEK